MPTKPWNIKKAFFEVLADYIRENDCVPGVESVNKVDIDTEVVSECSEGCCDYWEPYVEIHYTDIDGNKHIHKFSGSLEDLLEI